MSQFDRIEQKIDSIDLKLDTHLDRISKAEEAIGWIKGHLKVSLSLAITIIGSLSAWLLTKAN